MATTALERTVNVLTSPFETASLEDARKIVGAAVRALSAKVNVVPPDRSAGLPDYIILNPLMISRAFIHGDHWQSSLGWIGPRPQIDDPAYVETMNEIARQFVSKNVIGEIVGRHVSGVLGIEPHWGFTSRAPVPEGEEVPAETQALIDEAEALVTEWWDTRGAHELLQRVAVRLLYAERGPLRLYVPRGMLLQEETTDGAGEPVMRSVLAASSLADAMNMIWPDDPEPDNAAMATDPATKQHVGVVLFKVGGGYDETLGTDDRAEVVFLEDRGQNPRTVIRSVSRGGKQDFLFDFGGRLPFYEGRRPLFVSPQMWQQQRALNLAESMAPRAIVTGGFLERTILNAQMPGRWETGTDGRSKKFIPEPYLTGPGSTNFLTGIELPQKDGAVQLSTPSVHHREPTPVTPLIEASRASYANLLEEGQQEHTLAYQNSHASGKTHEQARADFMMSLLKTQSCIEPMGRWLIETLVAMAEEISGEKKYLAKLRAYFTCRIDKGPISAAERAQNDASVVAGTLSVESAIVLNGETDPDAELQKIANAPGAGLKIIERQAAVILQLTQAGSTLHGAAEAAGMDEALIKKLVGDGVVPVNVLPPGTVQ